MLQIRLEESDLECQNVREELSTTQQALRNAAARTLQRALKSAVNAARGDSTFSGEYVTIERQASEIRHLEAQMADLRKVRKVQPMWYST